MNRSTLRTTGLVAAAAALTVGGYTLAGAGQAATPAHAPMGSMSMGATVYKATGPVIRIADYTFHAPVSLKKGATVTVRNTDGTTHTVTSNAGLFGVRVPAHSTRTFRAPGRVGNFSFHCNFHANMHGTLRVR